MAERLNIDQTEANLIEQGFNIFGHGQPDQIVNYVRANLPANHPALIYYIIHTIAQRKQSVILPKHKRKWLSFYESFIKVSNFKDYPGLRLPACYLDWMQLKSQLTQSSLKINVCC